MLRPSVLSQKHEKNDTRMKGLWKEDGANVVLLELLMDDLLLLCGKGHRKLGQEVMVMHGDGWKTELKGGK